MNLKKSNQITINKINKMIIEVNEILLALGKKNK